MKTHIITGYKGGTGRTLMTLCSIDFYRSINENVVVFDANTSNSNQYSTSGLLLPSRKEKMIRIGGLNAWSFDGGLFVLEPQKGFISPLDFWLYLGEIYDYFGSENYVFIIDTNWAPHLLVEDIDVNTLGQCISRMDKSQLFIWYIWPSSGITPVDNNPISEISIVRDTIDAIDGLDNILLDLEIIHVLNSPNHRFTNYSVADYLQFTFNTALGRKPKGIPIGRNKYKKLSILPEGGRLSIEDMNNVLIGVWGRFKDMNAVNADDIFEAFADVVLETLTAKNHGQQERRPENLFPITIFSYKVMDYLNEMVLKGQVNNWDDVRVVIQDVSQDISRYLEAL